ncbi:hypothetical protein N431DRAFT_426418 [Stipitochalara longipes BDJ]|nr:hypothetical protein N431DRAFT_426418 [Stipitochalara longipes BDJ]
MASTKAADYMHRNFTMRRNTGVPFVWSRNVRALLVNIMLVEWEGEVARRLGVGKIYLDYWEQAGPKMRWVVLE